MVFYVEAVGGECKAESLRCAPDANGRLVSFRVYVRKLGKVEGETKGKGEGTGGKRREREEEEGRRGKRREEEGRGGRGRKKK